MALKAMGYIWSDTGRMEYAEAHALYASFSGDRLTFIYSGSFHDEHTARLINLGEGFLEEQGVARSVRGRLAFIMVEAYQNIVRHRCALPSLLRDGPGRSLFVLRSNGEAHEVIAMNPVTMDDAAVLKSELDRLGQLDAHQMKEVFLRVLRSAERTERGGAGLGLIEMARRSGHPLRHMFLPLDDTHRLFGLQVLLGPSSERYLGEGAMTGLHGTIAGLGITLAFRGALPPATQENLLRMVGNDLLDDPAAATRAKHAFLLLMEAISDLQVQPGGPMVCVAFRNGGCTLTLAMPLTAEMSDRLELAITSANALDAPSLQRRYRDILLGREGTASGLQLGMMDLVRRSVGKVRHVRGTWNNMPFVVLDVDI